MKQRHKISKKEFLSAINNSRSGWELIDYLTAALGYAGDKEVEKAENELIWREVSR